MAEPKITESGGTMKICKVCGETQEEHHIRLLRRDIETLEESNAIVRILPTTVDGKPVAPGMDVWELRDSGEIRKCFVLSVYTDKAECRCGWDGPDPAWYRCYSSETAAVKAKQERA